MTLQAAAFNATSLAFIQFVGQGQSVSRFAKYSQQDELLERVQALASFRLSAAPVLRDYLQSIDIPQLTLSSSFPILSVFKSLQLSLKELTLKKVQLNSLKPIFKAAPQLTTLTLEECTFSGTAALDLSSHLGQLTELHMSYMALSTEETTLLASSLAMSSKLQMCTLTCCFEEAGWIAISKALAANNGIKLLEIESNGIGKEGLDASTDLISQNRSLERLTLTFNYYSDPGSVALIPAIEKNQSLKYLNLSQNAMTESTLKSFSSLKKTSLEIIVPLSFSLA